MPFIDPLNIAFYTIYSSVNVMIISVSTNWALVFLQAPGSQISAQQQKERREQQIRRLKEFNVKKRQEKVLYSSTFIH